jgi:hypothetical protein
MISIAVFELINNDSFIDPRVADSGVLGDGVVFRDRNTCVILVRKNLRSADEMPSGPLWTIFNDRVTTSSYEEKAYEVAAKAEQGLESNPKKQEYRIELESRSFSSKPEPTMKVMTAKIEREEAQE